MRYYDFTIQLANKLPDDYDRWVDATTEALGGIPGCDLAAGVMNGVGELDCSVEASSFEAALLRIQPLLATHGLIVQRITLEADAVATLAA